MGLCRTNVMLDRELWKEAQNAGKLDERSGSWVLNKALIRSGIYFSPFFIVEDVSHNVINELLKQDKYIDLIIPRGGESLIRKVVRTSHIPVN